MVAALSYQVLTFNLAAAKVKLVFHNGRSYLVAPASLIVPGVLNGSDGPGYYPPDETSRNVASWDDMPIIVYHPTKDGQAIAAQDPIHREHVGKSTVGFLKNTRFNDHLLTETWFDEEHVKNYDAQLPQWAKMYPRLTSNTPIELSTGLHVDRDETPGVCPKTGRPYDWVARNYRPDHLAVLPDQKGACSVADGCGVVMNTENAKEESEGKWVTLPNGVHVQVKDGEIVKGPKVSKAEKDTGKRTDRREEKKSEFKKSNERADRKEAMGNLKEKHKVGDTFDHPEFGKVRMTASGIEPVKNSSIKEFFSVINAGKFGNPQHLETGKFQPHGSGTGKGEVHEAAKEGRHGKECDCGGECDKCKQLDQGSGKDQAVTNGDKNMSTATKLPKAERDGLVSKIVANCKCEGGDDVAIINSLSDAALMQLNAMSMEKDEGSSIVASSTEEPKDKKDKKEKEVPPQFTKNQKAEFESEFVKNLGFESMGHIKATLNAAKKVEFRERKALLERIVANVETSKKEAVWNRYKDRDIAELESIIELLPARQVANSDELRFPNYSGAPGYTAPVENKEEGADDFLDTPVMNWKD